MPIHQFHIGAQLRTLRFATIVERFEFENDKPKLLVLDNEIHAAADWRRAAFVIDGEFLLASDIVSTVDEFGHKAGLVGDLIHAGMIVVVRTEGTADYVFGELILQDVEGDFLLCLHKQSNY